MNSMERVVAALQLQKPDRVPNYPILSGVTRNLVGATYKEWSTDSTICSNALIKAAEDYEQDCIVTLVDLSIEADAWGLNVIFPENEAAHPDYTNPVIKSVEDYAKIKKVDYRKSERMMMHIDTCKKLVEKKGGEIPIVAFVFGPLGVLSMLRNQQEMFIDIYDDKEALYKAASEITETLKEYVAALIETGVNGIMFDTLFASGTIMSKEMWFDLEGDLSKQLADVCHEKGIPVMIHNCGQNVYFDAQIKAMNPMAISFLWPPDDCKDFADCKEKYGKKVCLIGCVPPPMVITATDEEFAEECKREIDILGKDGGFILATGCEYPANSSFDKAQVMAEVAKTYGKY